MISDDDYDSDDYEETEDSESETSDEDTSSGEGETSDEENSADARGWTKLNATPPVISPSPPPFDFTANSGVQCSFDEQASILKYFESFIDDDIIDMIVTETNRNAESKLRGMSEDKKSKWHPTTRNEIRVFLAITILQSIVKKPDLQLYW